MNEVHDIIQETGIKTIPMEKKCKKAKWLSEEALQIVLERREAKSKGKKERYTHLIGEGNGNPLHCSCLENPKDGGAWWAAIYWVAQSRTRLKRLSSSSRLLEIQPKHQSTSFYKCENSIPEQEGGNGPVLTAKSLAYTGFNVQIPP